MNLETKLRGGIAMSLLSFIILTFFYFQQKNELEKCQTDKGYIPGGDIEKAQLQALVDSLHDENFIKSTEIGRYEITFDHLKEVNPKLGQELEEWMSHNTE